MRLRPTDFNMLYMTYKFVNIEAVGWLGSSVLAAAEAAGEGAYNAALARGNTEQFAQDCGEDAADDVISEWLEPYYG